MTRFLLLLLLAASSSASAIVIRHDVDDAQYRVAASAFPALADMPGEGHGVLIAPQWLITAAHTISWQHEVKTVTINGVARDVARIEIHPGYKPPAQALINQALASGEWILAVNQIAASDDISLIKLAQPVTDVAPVALYPGNEQIDKVVQIIGKGATGNGETGHVPAGPNRTELRRAFNKITSAHERWFCYVFDAPATALPLEGKTGSGDSGGPVLIETDGQWQLAGLAAWGLIHGDVRVTRPGLYGQFTCNVRLSHYRDWIEQVMAEQP